MTVNGQERSAEVEPRMLLVHFLRDRLGLTGTHIGCDTTSCGACTVLLDGTPVKSCTMFAVQAEGRELTTEASLDATERHDYFSGEESLAGVMDELDDKPGGPDGGER